MPTLALIQLLLMVSIFATQDAAKPIVVKTDSQTPVTLVGTVHSAQTDEERRTYSYLAHISVGNVSGKNISLLVYRIDVAVPIKAIESDERPVFSVERSAVEINDFCFGQQLFRAGKTLTAEIRMAPYADKQLSPDALSGDVISGEVEFVQFSDGTTYGKSDAATQALNDRRKSLERLEQLDEIYKNYGDLGLAQELSVPSQLLPINILQDLYNKDRRNIPAVVQRMTKMLEAAKSRIIESH